MLVVVKEEGEDRNAVEMIDSSGCQKAARPNPHTSSFNASPQAATIARAASP